MNRRFSAKRFPPWFLGAFLFFSVALSCFGGEALLVIRREIPPISAIEQGVDPFLRDVGGDLRVFGRISFPNFKVSSLRNLRVTDAGGNELPFQVDRSSVYSEFDESEIDGLSVSFVISEAELERGAPTLYWGGEIASSPVECGSFVLYAETMARYGTFGVELRSSEDRSGQHYATLDVIVDDRADTYYLWYLLPLILIFILLGARRVGLA
jgi:hypothetical protein